MVRVEAEGKESASTFRPVAHYGRIATLVEVEIHTGRTHQIRVHAAYAGHPVAGDDKYGDREFNAAMVDLGLKRMFLHASSVSFDWPDRGDEFSVNAPLPRGSRRGHRRARLRKAGVVGDRGTAGWTPEARARAVDAGLAARSAAACAAAIRGSGRSAKEGLQPGRDPDQWQPDQGRRVAALDALHQADAQALGLEAAGAIAARARARHAARFRASRTGRGNGSRVVDVFCRIPASMPTMATAVWKVRRSAPDSAASACAVGDGRARLAEHAIPEGADLVRADHQRLRMPLGDRSGLGHGEPHGERSRLFAGEADFIHLGHRDLETESQSLEQRAPMPRGRRQPERANGRKGVFFGHGNNEFREWKVLTRRRLAPIIRAPCRPTGHVPLMSIVWPTRGKSVSSTSIWPSFRVSRTSNSRAWVAMARGSLRASSRVRGVRMVDVVVQADIPLVCQRCLGVVEVPVDSAARVAIVADLAAADALDAEHRSVRCRRRQDRIAGSCRGAAAARAAAGGAARRRAVRGASAAAGCALAVARAARCRSRG